jgi:hypothetical protein
MTTHAAAETSQLVTRSLHPAITSDAGTFEAAVSAAQRVVVPLERPGPEHRAKLLSFVLSAIETQLERLGAAPSGCSSAEALETILSDQLYRTRLLGAGGLALRFAALDGVADASGELSVEDSQALRRMFALAEHQPLQVFLPEPCAGLCVAGAPQRLSDWLPSGSSPGRVASIEYEIENDTRAEPAEPRGAELSGLEPPSLHAFLASDATHAPIAESADSAPAEPTAVVDDLELRGIELRGADSDSGGLQAIELRGVDSDRIEHLGGELDGIEPHGVELSAAIELSPAVELSAQVELPSAEPPAERASGAPALPEPAEAAALSPEANLEPSLDEQQQRRYASWAAQLQGMHGPKLHASVERAFVTAYLPLAREVAAGKAPREIRATVESWAEGFAQSYAAAFKTMSSHARRPNMVRDVFDLGLRWLNQHHARHCQLLLVDAMRFDLGQRLNEELERRLSGQAVCRDQALLWAALPSNSEAQRISDGAAARAARAAKGKAPAEPTVEATGVQTLRLGSRELFRVDLLASDLAKPGELEANRLERLTAMLSDAIVPWMKSQPPDTLVLVFGDHGFYWQAGAQGTSPAQRGGALPEQVLVPASAWMLGRGRPKSGLASGLH